MVQEFHVLRCSSCQTFQVQQVKKATRWTCKLCGEKQSLLKEFGRGSGADCRRHVQKLNAMRGAMMEEQEGNTWSLWKQAEADGEDEPQEQPGEQVTTHTQVTESHVSCWNKYLDAPKEAEPEEEEEEENVWMDRKQLLSNRRVDRKRKRREGWSDRRGRDSWTPEQSNQSNLMTHTSAPSLRNTSAPSVRNTSAPSVRNTSAPSVRNTSAPSLTNTSAPSVRNTSAPSVRNTSAPSVRNTSAPSLTHTSAPSVRNTSAPSLNSTSPLRNGTGPVSKWARFLSSDCQLTEREEPSDSGRSHLMDKAPSLSCTDIIQQTPPLHQPRPLLPVSSMFQSGEDFDFDDDFLTN